jgi:hypothetical protein
MKIKSNDCRAVEELSFSATGQPENLETSGAGRLAELILATTHGGATTPA